jgi:hypothetical protein
MEKIGKHQEKALKNPLFLSLEKLGFKGKKSWKDWARPVFWIGAKI